MERDQVIFEESMPLPSYSISISPRVFATEFFLHNECGLTRKCMGKLLILVEKHGKTVNGPNFAVSLGRISCGRKINFKSFGMPNPTRYIRPPYPAGNIPVT